MSQAPGGLTTEDPEVEADPVLKPEDHTMAAVDAALAPAFRTTALVGVVQHSELHHILTAVRQALAHAIYGAPAPTEDAGESLDVYGDARRGGDAYRAYLEQFAADNPKDAKPLSLADWRAQEAEGEVDPVEDGSGFSGPGGEATKQTLFA